MDCGTLAKKRRDLGMEKSLFIIIKAIKRSVIYMDTALLNTNY